MIQLRSYLYAAFMAASTLVIGVLGLPSLLRRDWAVGVSKAWCRTLLWGARVFCGLRWRVEGRELLTDGPAVIAAKHQSMWETLAIMTLLPDAAFVLKRELSRIPFFGWYARANGFIFVDRQAGAKALREMTGAAKEAVAHGRQIVIFPEGTRSPIGEHLPYQPGVAALVRTLGVPCVPVTHNAGVFWRHPGLERRPGTIVLKILDPFPADTPRPALIAGLEEAIEPATRALEAEALDSLEPAA
ncbi:lysophospholipid acyltransferase family protein [Parvularcula dongshanensis]|uniref:1-acyl-sn-glycerol-3-phosphate acyltransferase n=1 Tax=Parvularcula dongshanensis TaxID=1173995 RepID=A0A840I329_9PROT|nr:lysophospholipid acyltransferase family protein [Parvularcula dongshanensis]MBB4658588.1 1-acyl-sn-glycerol-3-phosphate acyltransferase [Parvularcula dongshanensis]